MHLTLLPLADFAASASKLKDEDLASSLKACDYLLTRFVQGRTPTQPWATMWAGHVGALATLGAYYAADSWHRATATGVTRNKTKAKDRYFKMEKWRKELVRPRRIVKLPDWFGIPEFHESHRNFLEARDYDALWWPTEEEEVFI